MRSPFLRGVNQGCGLGAGGAGLGGVQEALPTHLMVKISKRQTCQNAHHFGGMATVSRVGGAPPPQIPFQSGELAGSTQVRSDGKWLRSGSMWPL